jgi:hypothetical protein
MGDASGIACASKVHMAASSTCLCYVGRFRARSLKTQQEGYVPSNFFVLKTSFSTEPWFHGQLSRQEADRYLSRVNRVREQCHYDRFVKGSGSALTIVRIFHAIWWDDV